MPEEVISNAGPLMAFAKLNLLHLLKQMYGRVYFPSAVYQEVVIEGIRRGFEDAHTLRLFLSREKSEANEVGDIPQELTFSNLDKGERESIALAMATHRPLLIDEEQGRKEARQRGVTIRRTIGVLARAYRRGLIPADQLSLYFQEIEERKDIWISPALCRRVLRHTLDEPLP
ncbi:MAG: DUF3368 domain-containing protein [Candidatus Latescibacteria bacterium]|nr:DUF3368 domain-containing protein [Candidatus Latescibacterota bacterium]